VELSEQRICARDVPQLENRVGAGGLFLFNAAPFFFVIPIEYDYSSPVSARNTLPGSPSSEKLLDTSAWFCYKFCGFLNILKL